MTDTIYKIALTKVPKLGPVLTRQLVAWCGGPEAVFHTPEKDLLKIPGIGKGVVKALSGQAALDKAAEELAFTKKNGIRPLFYLDEDYPRRLIHHNDSPILLYYKGNADLNPPRTVGVVGTRKPSQQGRIICEEIVGGLKEYGVTIISGLAYGIDVTAHRKSLGQGIPTIGCLGHGLHMIYPAAHRKTAEDMMRCGGLLTEFTSDQKPDAPHFPMRNRIIAGLSDAVIVIETACKGGSMITANMANGYNKDVFAVPGRPHDTTSEGCNLLIKSHRAQLLTSAEDIGYIMRWEKGPTTTPNVQRRLFLEFSPNGQRVVDCLKDRENKSIDAISYQTGLAQGELSLVLLDLEMKGAVKSLPGKRFVLV